MTWQSKSLNQIGLPGWAGIASPGGRRTGTLPCLTSTYAAGESASPKAGHPHKVLHLTSYERLEQYLRAFAEGHFGLLILVGDGGLAKSRSVQAVLNGRACWIEGNASPFGMYVKLYRHRDQFVVIDDVDALYADRSGVRLLKCLCQTEEEKSVAWHSDTHSLEPQGIPREFTTKSRVVIISNDWKTLNKNVAALQDRGHVLLFQPDAAEVHRKAGTWFDDPEIYAGSPPICTGCASRRCGITCGPGSSRPPAWTGPRSWRTRRRTSGPGWRPSCWPARLQQHGGAGEGVRRAGGGCGRRSSITSVIFSSNLRS